MTKEKIIESLTMAAKPNESYYIEDEVRQAIMQFQNPEELIAPILDIIGTNPTTDFGMPGDLVHFVEMFSNRGYEELLINSVKNTPTPHNIWMLHRCFNDPKDNRHDIYKKLIECLKSSSTTSEIVKREIENFNWD